MTDRDDDLGAERLEAILVEQRAYLTDEKMWPLGASSRIWPAVDGFARWLAMRGWESASSLRQRIAELERTERALVEAGKSLGVEVIELRGERDRALAAARDLRAALNDCMAFGPWDDMHEAVLARTAWLDAPEEPPCAGTDGIV